MTKQDKVAKVMHEWKAGTLTSNGKQVTDYDQAVAIALSEAKLSKYARGGWVLYDEDDERLIKVYETESEARKNLYEYDGNANIVEKSSWDNNQYDKGGEFEDADDFIENVKEMHESIDYVVLKDGTKVNGYDLMEKGGDMNEYSKGGNVIERRYVNKDQDYETRYAKNRPSRMGYKDERKFAVGGGIDSDEAIETYVQYKSVILERVGNNIYLTINGKTWKLTKSQLNELLEDLEEYSNPLTASEFLMDIDKSKYENITSNKFAVGGEIGNTVSFKGDYGTPRSGVIKEKRGSSYIVGTDDGDRLVDSYEVISFSETPIAKKKRFGFFEGGGEISDLGFAYLADLWFVVQQRDTDDYEKLSKYLDEEGISHRIQNEVSADASELRGRKSLSISEVHDRIKKILAKKYAGGGEIDGVSFSRLKSNFKNNLEIFNGEVVTIGDNKFKIEGNKFYIKRPNEDWTIFRIIKGEMFAGGGEIENKIEKLKKVVSSKMINESARALARTKLAELEKELHESKETKAEEKAEHEVGGSEYKEKVGVSKIKILWAEGDNSKYDKFPKEYSSWSLANKAVIPVYKDTVDDEGYNKLKFEVTFKDGETYDGRLDVSEKEDNPIKSNNAIGQHIKDYLDYMSSEKSASSEDDKKEIKEWLEKYDLGLDTKEENKMTSGSEEKDYIEAKTKALEKSLKDKTISETQRKRDEKELALFKGAEAKKPKFKIGDYVKVLLPYETNTYGIITGYEEGSHFESHNGYKVTGIGDPLKEDQIKKVTKAEYDRPDFTIPATPSKPTTKKPTTRKAPVKKAVVKKVQPQPKFKVGERVVDENYKGNYEILEIKYAFNPAEGKPIFYYNLNGKGDIGSPEYSLKKYTKPKADHKKLVAKLKAKKGGKEYDNRASLVPFTDKRRERSESSDRKREALPLGKRVSADGNVYYERRLNRGDISKEDKFERGGFIYEVQKKGSPSNDMRETMFTAKNLTELKKQIIKKYGTSKDFLVRRRTEQGYYVTVKFEDGGEIKNSGWGLNLNW